MVFHNKIDNGVLDFEEINGIIKRRSFYNKGSGEVYIIDIGYL
jgi:hypothetical protein